MKKLLLLSLLLPLLFLAQGVKAESYRYDCLCLYSDPRGTCREYTCDAYRSNTRRSYYYNDRSCDNGYGNCNSYQSNYRPRYWNSSVQYNDNQGYDYNWYYNRYNPRPTYYNYPGSNYDYRNQYYY